VSRRFPMFIAILILAWPGVARAAHFDLVHVERMDVTLCNGCGITLSGADFALFANKQATPVVGSEFFAATFEATSSEPTIRLNPFVNNPGSLFPLPLQPGTVVGSVANQVNAVLLTRIQPGEMFVNTSPLQVISLQIDRFSGSYEGPVTFDVAMTVGTETARFLIHADLHLGSHHIVFRSATRTTSQEPIIDASPVSWGRLKAAYR